MTAPTASQPAAHVPHAADAMPSRPSLLVVGILTVVATFLAFSAVILFDRVAPSLPLALLGGLGLMGLVGLAVGRYEAAVFLGFLLSGVVKFEPAPPDGVFAVIIAVAIVSGRFRLDRLPAPVAVLLALFTSISVLSFAAAENVGGGVRFFAIALYLVIFAIWLTGYADSERRGRQIVVAWLCIAVFSAIVGTLALQFQGFPARTFFLHYDDSRTSALFKDPNVFGPFLIPIAVILLEEIIAPRLLRLRTITGFTLLGILLVGLIFSFSRAAWANMLLATAVMLFIMLLRRRHMKRLFGVLFGLGIVGMVVLGVIVFAGQADFIGQRAQLQQYDTQRFGAQRAGLELASEYPVGVGPGQFMYHHPVETHSAFVRVLAEQGPFGLVLWVALCLLTLGFAIANAFAGRNPAGIGSAALLGVWVGLLFNSFVVDTLHWRHLWVVAALIWAGALVGSTKGDDDARLRLAARRRPDRDRLDAPPLPAELGAGGYQPGGYVKP